MCTSYGLSLLNKQTRISHHPVIPIIFIHCPNHAQNIARPWVSQERSKSVKQKKRKVAPKQTHKGCLISHDPHSPVTAAGNPAISVHNSPSIELRILLHRISSLLHLKSILGECFILCVDFGISDPLPVLPAVEIVPEAFTLHRILLVAPVRRGLWVLARASSAPFP